MTANEKGISGTHGTRRGSAFVWAIGHAKRTVSICVRRTGALAAAFNLRLAPHLWAGAPASIEGLYVAAIPDHPDLGITVRDNFVERHARRS